MPSTQKTGTATTNQPPVKQGEHHRHEMKANARKRQSRSRMRCQNADGFIGCSSFLENDIQEVHVEDAEDDIAMEDDSMAPELEWDDPLWGYDPDDPSY